MGLQKRVWTNEQDLGALEQDWDTLLAHSAFSSPFMSAIWHRVWWKHFPEGQLHLVGWYDDGRLVGLAPFYIADGSAQCCLRPVGGVEIADYLDVLAWQGYEQTIYNALLDHLASDDAPPWQEVNLINLPEATLTHTELPRLARERGCWAWVDVEDVCPIIPLPESFEAYLYTLNKKQRHEVRRKLRRLHRQAEHVRRWVVNADEGDLDHAMDLFITLHRRSDPEKAAFMTPRMEAFFREIVRVARERGWLHLAFLEVDGRQVATLLCFDYEDRRMVYNSGFDPEVARELSPGVNLVVMEIEDAIAQGLRIFDFLQGDEEYKFRLGAKPTYVYRLQIRRTPPETTP